MEREKNHEIKPEIAPEVAVWLMALSVGTMMCLSSFVLVFGLAAILAGVATAYGLGKRNFRVESILPKEAPARLTVATMAATTGNSRSFGAVGEVADGKAPAYSPKSGNFRGESMLPPDMFDLETLVGQLKDQGLYGYLTSIEEYLGENRIRVAALGVMVMFGSYSYLGLNDDSRIRKAACAAIQRYGSGTHGVRMLAGTLNLHGELEGVLAEFLRAERAVTFSSGYSANVSIVSSLVDRRDAVFCDKLNHASIMDGCLLSKAKFVRYRHNDMNDLEKRLKNATHARRRLVVVDSVFSMDGDIVNLRAVAQLCQNYNAILMVDEAHGLGVLGETGRGVEEHFGLHGCVDIRTGSLSKAIPSVGGFAVGTRKLCEYLHHQARSFIYSAPVPPGSAAAALAALRVLSDEPWRVGRLRANTRYFADAVADLGLPLRDQETPIFPIICGSDQKAWELAAFCRAHGIYVQAIPYPVVPKDTARLRVSITATHTRGQMDTFINVLRDGGRAVGIDWAQNEELAKPVLCEA